MADKNNALEQELSGLRGEVYEARNLIIKTDNLLKTLHAELKSVSKKQEQFERRHFASSVAAYVIFAVLVAGAAVLAFGAVIGPEREAAQTARLQAQERLASAEKASQDAARAKAAQEQASLEALAVYELLTSPEDEQRTTGLARMAELDMERVPPLARRVLTSTAALLRREAASQAWERGRRAFIAERFEESAEALTTVMEHSRFLDPAWEQDMRAQAAYYLGAAQNRLGRHDQAIGPLRAYVESHATSANTIAYAYLLLGDSLENLDRRAEALEAFQAGVVADPNGRHASILKRRVSRAEAALKAQATSAGGAAEADGAG